MGLGLAALMLAVGLAGWFLVRLARQNGTTAGGGSVDAHRRSARNELAFKAILWLAITAVLFAVKLWPLALMVLIAAAAVTGIEFWRQETVDRLEADPHTGGQSAHGPRGAKGPSPALTTLDPAEARAVLGLGMSASDSEIKAAHRRLIAQLHPDSGGSDYLAAKINAARDVLLISGGDPEKKSAKS